MTEPMRLSQIFLRAGAIQGGGGPNEAEEASLSEGWGGGRGGEGGARLSETVTWITFSKEK